MPMRALRMTSSSCILARGSASSIAFSTGQRPPLPDSETLQEIVARAGTSWPDQQIDELVRQLFLTEDARKGSNLQFVRSTIEASPARRQLLRLYQRVYEGRIVAEDERAALQKRLKLTGLIRVEDGVLRVRNEIYRQVFDQAWIKANTPINWIQIATVAAVLLALVAFVYATVLLLPATRANPSKAG